MTLMEWKMLAVYGTQQMTYFGMITIMNLAVNYQVMSWNMKRFLT